MRLLFALCLIASLSAIVGANDEDSRPPALREVSFDQNLGSRVPLDIPLRDESGKTVRLADYFGSRPVVLSLVYYECPMLCTVSLNGLTSALGSTPLALGQDFEVVTVSFNARETPELALAKKRAYLKRLDRAGAENGWHFLTGDESSIRAITNAVGFRYAWDAASNQFAHPAGIVVLTPDGVISRYLYGIEYAPKDLRFALLESSARRIGRPIDNLLLYCYKYDPHLGRYGAAVMRLLRLTAIATLLALGGFIWVMRRREIASSRS